MQCLRRGASLLPVVFLLVSHSSPPQSIEGMLRNMTGIHSVRVALLAERGVVDYDPEVWDPEKIINVSAYLSPPSLSPHRVLIVGNI